MRVDKLSRHLYDVYHLSKTPFAENAINNQELYETIVAHRYKFSRVGGVESRSLKTSGGKKSQLEKYLHADW